jgi:hypothetical protein
MKISTRFLSICILIACAALGGASAASACYSQCVAGPDSDCYRCESPGYYTGNVCTQVSACKCKETPGVCPWGGDFAQSPLAELGIQDSAQCSARQAAPLPAAPANP